MNSNVDQARLYLDQHGTVPAWLDELDSEELEQLDSLWQHAAYHAGQMVLEAARRHQDLAVGHMLRLEWRYRDASDAAIGILQEREEQDDLDNLEENWVEVVCSIMLDEIDFISPSCYCPYCGSDQMTDHPDGESGQCADCGKRS